MFIGLGWGLKFSFKVSSSSPHLFHQRKALCLTFFSYCFHFLFILHFHIPFFLFLLLVCKYLLFTFYSVVSEIVYMRNYFIHELELENDRGTVEKSLLFLVACFFNKISKILLKKKKYAT